LIIFLFMKTSISTRKKVWLSFAFIVLLVIFVSFVVYPNVGSGIPGAGFFNKFYPHLGLDLQGGTHLVYQADMSQIPTSEKTSALEGVRDVIERRVNAFGVSEPVVQTSNNYRLIVELAGVQDVNQAIQMIGETPLLEFKIEPTVQDQGPISDEELSQEELDAKAKAEDIIKQLQQGASFDELAKQYSEDPGSKENGGNLSWQKRGVFVTEFEKAIFDDLKVGEITSEPVKTQFGYHIIKKVDERGEGEDQEVLSSHILIAAQSTVPMASNVDWENTALSGKQLTRSDVQFDQTTGVPSVGLEFNDEGKDLFKQLTEQNVGKRIAIFLDGQVISAPVVNEAIPDGKAIITGDFNLAEAKLLAQRLNAGALPVPINLISQQTVGATLGNIYMQKSLLAGLIGLIAVAFFMIVYYRLPGLLSVVALVIYTLVALAIFEILPVTLTLAGIAGFILSVGMAVDANVLIFERLKEELILGKPLSFAIEEGFRRAWLSIRDSNFSSIITCIVLTWFGTSMIQGFAITLAIGILVSMFSAIIVTRTFLRLLSGQKMESKMWLFGVSIKKEVTEENK